MPQQKPLAGYAAARSRGSALTATAPAGSSGQRHGLGGGEPLAGAQRSLLAELGISMRDVADALRWSRR